MIGRLEESANVRSMAGVHEDLGYRPSEGRNAASTRPWFDPGAFDYLQTNPPKMTKDEAVTQARAKLDLLRSAS